jgi:hypothetical protein
MPVLLRPDGAVQVGWDPRRAVLVRPPSGLAAAELAALLRSMRSPIPIAELQRQAADRGLKDADGLTNLSQKGWWGDTNETDDSDPSSRTAVRVDQTSPTSYEVTIFNAIGAIGLADLQRLVQPKIPMAHLLYLLAESQHLPPRSSEERASVKADEGFFVLLVRWFLDASERLLRLGLDRDYQRVTADLAFARGRVNLIPTARSIFSGRPKVRCEFDYFSEDTSLNRVLKAAARKVLASPTLVPELRQRGRRVHQRLDAAGEIRTGDLRVVPEPHRRHYRDAHQLASAILTAGGISLASGAQPAWTFLFRTPEAVEEGVRSALKRQLQPAFKVERGGRYLASGDVTGTKKCRLTPDLVLGEDQAIGDVKYMTTNGEVSRPHLYQATTFATGYGATRASVVGFDGQHANEHVQVGVVKVQGFCWDTTETDPEVAAARLAYEIKSWLVVVV